MQHNPELLAAIQERIALGYTDEQIHQELRAAGYDDTTIDDVLLVTRSSRSSTATKQLISYSELLSESWQLLLTQRAVFLRAARDYVLLVVAAGTLLIALLFGLGVESLSAIAEEPDALLETFFSPWLWLGVFVVCVVIGMIGKAIGFAMQRTVLLRQQTESYTHSLGWSLRNIVAIFWLAILVSLVTQLGYALLFIPGLVLAVYLVFANYLLATDRARGIAALVRSIELVYERWWAVLGRLVVVMIVLLTGVLAVGGAVLVIGTLLATIAPWVGAGVVLLSVIAIIIMSLAFSICAGVLLFESLYSTQAVHFSAARVSQLRTGLIIAAVLGLFASGFSSALQGDESLFIELQTARTAAEQAALAASLEAAPALAKTYELSSGSYEGVCNELSLVVMDASSVDCIDRADRWALAVATEAGREQCIDSTNEVVVSGGLQSASAQCQTQQVAPEPSDGQRLKDWAQELRQQVE